MSALEASRAYGIVVRLADLGNWGDVELRSEYDPVVPEIRINSRIVESMTGAERERFVALAVGHELYHHREHLGEIPLLSSGEAREAAADAYALELIGKLELA